MAELLLNSLEIDGFRAFDHLRIERLGRVNLVVGRNNVGKTSLLEALWLYASAGDDVVLYRILEQRDEQRYDASGRELLLRESMRFVLHGRAPVGSEALSVKVGPIGTDQSLVDVERGSVRSGSREDAHQIPHTFVTASDLGPGEVERLWDGIALTDLQDDVRKALKIIAPEVVNVNMIANPGGRESASGGRIPMARVEGVSVPLPLRNLGEGMNRLFGLTLAMVNSKNGLLLVDEIESGLHYTVQVDLWRLIFATAKRLDVQVFATTHSWDCIEAFQAAACEDRESEGMLIRLDRRGETIVPMLYDEETLAVAARERIEVR